MKRIASIFNTKKVRKEAKEAAKQINNLLYANGPLRPTAVKVEKHHSSFRLIVTEGDNEYKSKIHGLEERATNPVFCDCLCQALLRDQNFQQNGVTLEKKR